MTDRPSVDSARILIVDDEPSVRDALGALYTSWGFYVSTAASGPLALEAASREHPDLVVLDLALPGMEGITVCQRIREWSRVPILVLSARGEEAQKIAALEAGADDYVTKPFGPGELRARTRASLRREQSRLEEASAVTVGELMVDLATRRVHVGGAEVHLTRAEYELLRILITNRGRVVTHASLLRSVMGPGYEDALESLRTYVKQLRRKIEPDPARPRLIVNELGVGYRLVRDP